jgi:hypothetical protein
VDVFFNRQPAYLFAPLLTDLFRYSYEANFIQVLLKKNEKKLARSFNISYMDNILPLNNCKFGDIVDHIYPIELEMKDTTDIDRSASYFDFVLEKNIFWCLTLFSAIFQLYHGDQF